jgi:uridine kinase
MTETAVFEQLKNRILEIQQQKQKVVRVGINGIEGTGKTVFCTKLTHYLVTHQLNAIPVSIDGYHNTKEIRYQQGRDSAKGYYEDGYSENEFVEKVLKSSQNPNPNYTAMVHDLETDEILHLEPETLSENAIILTDGAYLFKDIYFPYWDLKIYLKTDFETAAKRGINRDLEQLGGFEKAKEKYDNRYHLASKMYMEVNNPENKADIIINNSNFDDLIIEKNT